MDAALTGLIGALGGGTIGAGGAWGAAIIAFKGARYQADKQARSAREQWLWQLRREPYAEFVRATRAAARHEVSLWRAGSDLPRLHREVERNPEHREALAKAAADLELIAPRTVMDLAEGLVDAISMRLGVATLWVQEHSGEPYETDPPHFARERVINEFVTLARLDLQGFAANVGPWPVD
ncbi:hypothetical protein AB0I22_15780 [Streptomyces sp. NPDC050610]|uniref:hypothetical protein n=1 Tax=Streptomyces sp. NPDC050610 TaxID=3157097 RepID=UPI003419FFB6